MSTALNPQHRSASLDALASFEVDVLVVGGGVVGAGTALDAVTRGLTTGLVEQRDFASGTCLALSKLIHGGLRYLEMLDFGLVREALEERGLLLTRLAPHLVRPVPFLYPLTHRGWERPYVGAGLALYDAMAMAGKYDMGVPRHKHLSRRGALRLAPDLRPDALVGAIRYYDAQVDDARHMMLCPDRRDARRARRQPHQGGRLPARGRAGHRCPGRRPGDRPRDRRTGPGGGERRGCLDQRHPGARRRPRVAQGPGQQGDPPRRAPRPDPLRHRADPAHREVRAVRDPVGPALDHRHHRHPVGPRQGAPGGVARRHRLPARARQPGAQGAARPRRRRGRLRRAPAARVRASPSRPAGSRASTPWSRRCPGW